MYLSVEDLDETIGEVGFFYQCTASDGKKCCSATYDASHFEYSGESRVRFVSEGGSYVAVSPSEASVAPGSPAVFNANVKVSGVHLEEDDGWYVVHEEIADEETLILGECAFRLDPAQSEYTYSYDWHYTEDFFGWDESSFRYAINGTRLTVSNLDDSISKVGFFYQCTGSHGHKYRSAAYSDDYYDYKYEGESTVRIVPEAPDASRVTLNWTSKPYNGSVQKPTVTVKNKAGYTVPENVYYTVSSSAESKNPGNYQVTVTGRNSFSGSVTLARLVQPLKAESPMVSTPLPMVTCPRAVQPEKVPSWIAARPFPKSARLRLVQSENA